VKLTLDAITKSVSDAIPVVAGQSAAWEGDQENLIVMAQYPVARRVIQRMLAKGDSISTDDLPFEPRTTAIYLRLYGSQNKDVTYDEEKGALLKNA